MTLAIRLEPKLEQRITELARLTGRTKSYYVREALLRHLEDIEDLYTALHRLENPGSRYYTMEEVKKELGLAGNMDRKSAKGRKKPGSRRAKKNH